MTEETDTESGVEKAQEASPEKSPSGAATESAPKRRRGPLKIVFNVLLTLLGLIALLAGSLFLLRPYWELRGNFVPTFNFEKAEDRYTRLEEHRSAQRASAGVIIEQEEPQGQEPSAGEWGQYRGPERAGIYAETGLLKDWPEQGPPEIYRQPIGGGFAGMVIAGGRAYTLEQRRGKETVTCYDFASGVELWAFGYDAFFQEQMGGDGPRATPTLDGDRIYSLGPHGDLHCLDAKSGKVLWSRNVFDETDPKNLEWGMAGSPLIMDEKVIVTAAGFEGPSMLAYDKTTGDLIWKGVNQLQGYASLMEVTLVGRRQILNLAGFKLNGVDPEDGTVLWSFDWKATPNGINVAQPLFVGEDRVFVSSGYGKGCALVQLKRAGDRIEAEQVWANRYLKCKFNSPVYHDGAVYGLDEGILACVDLETGKRQWKGGRYGHGQMLYADGSLIVLGEFGELHLVRATPESFQEISSFDALEGKTWNTPAIAQGKLLIRNGREMACFDLRMNP